MVCPEFLPEFLRKPFAIPRRAGGDLLRGDAGDWLLQYGPGDYGIVEAARFEQVYRPLTDPLEIGYKTPK